MKVKLLVTRAAAGETAHPGDVVDLPTDEAKRLLESNQAEPVARKRVEKAEKR
jgi:hypothetical protein